MKNLKINKSGHSIFLARERLGCHGIGRPTIPDIAVPLKFYKLKQTDDGKMNVVLSTSISDRTV